MRTRFWLLEACHLSKSKMTKRSKQIQTYWLLSTVHEPCGQDSPRPPHWIAPASMISKSSQITRPTQLRNNHLFVWTPTLPRISLIKNNCYRLSSQSLTTYSICSLFHTALPHLSSPGSHTTSLAVGTERSHLAYRQTTVQLSDLPKSHNLRGSLMGLETRSCSSSFTRAQSPQLLQKLTQAVLPSLAAQQTPPDWA